MRFESSTYLYLLALIPLMVVLMMWAEWHRQCMLKRLGDSLLIKVLMPDASARRRWIKFSLVQIAIAMVILMLARPQMGTKVSHEKRNGIEAIIALDISNSMLAEDVQPSRLQKSKMLIENLVDHCSNDKIGMIVFAGDAFVQLPITSDYVSAKMFLHNIEPSLIHTQGTDIAAAIDLASNSFTQQKNIGKAIIVITDGEDHEGGAMEAAKAAQQKGYKVFILGIGNTSGAPIPLRNGGYMTDNRGETVMTALNEQMCREIAAAGSGTYIHVDNTSAAQERLNDELAKLQQGDMKSVVYSEYDEQFQAFGIIALLLIIIEVCMSEAINPYMRRFKLFKKRTPKTGNTEKSGMKISFSFKMLMPLLMMAFTLNISAQTDRQHVRSGNRMMRGGAQDATTKAEVQYRKALAANQSNPQAMYNLGCALMHQQKDSLAYDMFQKAAKLEKSKQRKAMSYHNMGVLMQKQQQYGPAIEQYKQALRLMPGDNETRYNLVLCQRLKKEDDKNNNGDGGNNNQNGKNNDKDKDKNKGKNKDQQNKDQNKDKQDQNKEQQNKQNQPQQQMSRENAEALLDAAKQEEKAVQQRMNKAMSQPQRRKLDKNW